MEKETLFEKYLEGELAPNQEKEILHLIAEDDDLREMLRFEHQLSAAYSLEDRPAVPPGFTDNVMTAIADKQSRAPGLVHKLKNKLDWLWQPKEFVWRPVYGFALTFMVAIAFFYSLYFMSSEPAPPQQQAANLGEGEQSVQQISTGAEEVIVRFIYMDDEAKTVAVAGDFSDWNPVELSPRTVNGEQVWSGFVTMERGEQSYMFLKDGSEWVTDPMAPVTQDDGFGNENAVLYL